MSMYIETSSSTSKPDLLIAAATPSIENMARIVSSPSSISGLSFFLLMLRSPHWIRRMRPGLR